jgi:hypothetical protein
MCYACLLGQLKQTGKAMTQPTIGKINERLDVLHKRLSRTLREIDKLRARRKRMLTGVIKMRGDAPKPVIHKWDLKELNDELPDDLKAIAPGSAGPC